MITEFELPAHTVGMGIKGCITWSTTPVRNYRDYKATDRLMAELSWLWGVNRHILTPPGLDEQWLVSLAHTDADMSTPLGTRGLAEALARLSRGPATGRGASRAAGRTGQKHGIPRSDMTRLVPSLLPQGPKPPNASVRRSDLGRDLMVRAHDKHRAGRTLQQRTAHRPRATAP